jgi:hypothetical protein
MKEGRCLSGGEEKKKRKKKKEKKTVPLTLIYNCVL